MEKWEWKGDGKIENGRIHYSSITSGPKVVTIGDTIFINFHAPELYVGKVQCFHENLTDGQACADIVWYFRPGEVEQWLAKIPKIVRPHLPPLSDREVVVTNFRDIIEISSISGQVHVQEVCVSTSMDTANSNDLIARFHFDITKKSISHLVMPGSSDPKELLSSGDDCDNKKSDSALHSKSPGSRVRSRSKGELRPRVSCSRLIRKLPLTSSRRIASSSFKDGRKKRCSYLNLLPTQSQPLPRLVSPSFVPDNHSSLLKSHTVSHDRCLATPTKLSGVSTDLLNSDPLRNQSSPNNWIGKVHPSFGKKMSTYVLSDSGVHKRSCDIGKGLPVCKVLIRSADCKRSPVRVSRSVQNDFEKIAKGRSNLSMLDVNKMIFDDDADADYVEEEEELVNEVKGGVSPETNASLKPDPIVDPVEKSKEFAQRKVHNLTRSLASCSSRNSDKGTPKSIRKTKLGRRKILINDSPFSEASCEDMLAMATPPSAKKVLCIPEKQEETPQRGKRSRKKKAMEDMLEKARQRLHVSSVPEALTCRDDEFSTICRFVEEKLEKRTGGCMYISGMPGVGKTATVKEVARYLQEAAEEKILPPFKFVEVNGMKLTDPRRVYVSIMMQLTGQKLSSDKAAAFLKAYFSSPNLTVLLADELDLLWTRKQEVLYDIFGWPGQLKSRLILLAVANTMDLHDRVMKDSTSSRLGLTRVDFKPYTYQQLQEIVKSRLYGLSVFAPDALELAARTIAVKCGDARRALDVCRRAMEIAEDFRRTGLKGTRTESGCLVGMMHIQKAIKEMCNLPMITAIKHATLYEKMFLRSVLAIFKSTGIEETTFQDVYLQLKDLLEMEGFAPLSHPLANDVCSSLCASGIIMEGAKQCHMLRKITLFPQPYEVTAVLVA